MVYGGSAHPLLFKKKLYTIFFFGCVGFEDFGVNFLVFKVNGQQIEGCIWFLNFN